MALGCGLTSVRGNRGFNYNNEKLVRQKHIKKNKVFQSFGQINKLLALQWPELINSINIKGTIFKL
jgi:hypothetical protein